MTKVDSEYDISKAYIYNSIYIYILRVHLVRRCLFGLVRSDVGS